VSSFRPSPLLRWSLHAVSAMFVVVILALIGVGAMFACFGDPIPWTLLGVGAGVSVLFIALNTAVAGMRLEISDDRAALRVGPWRRAAALAEAVIVVETTPVGVASVRIVPADGGKPLWLSAGWFRDFEAVRAELERRAVAGGGGVDVRAR
jgi:hypothetical protein